jgi:dienelactone hydrolase
MEPTNVMLFHSACGLRPAVRAAADRLRAAGHEV